MQEDIGRLLHIVSTELDKVSDQVLLERLGIGLSQYKILIALQERDGILQNQIAGHLQQTEASISRQIKLLKNKRLIDVRINPGNRRERKTFLTDKGLQVANRATETLNDYHAPLFGSLSEQEQVNMIRTLQKIARHLGD